MNPYAARGLLVLVSVALVLLAAEALFRLIPASGDDLRGLHQGDPGLPWLYSLRPGATARLDASGEVLYEVNRDGYRGPAISTQKPATAQRVLVLGDSVAFGYGVSEADTFARRLESTAEADPTLEVLNFGVGGYNPYNEAALLRGKGTAYAPDVVLVQFCINDLNDPTGHFDAQTRIEVGTIPDAAFPDPRERRRTPDGASCWRRPCECSRVCQAARHTVARWTGGAPRLDAAALKPRELPPGVPRHWIGDLYQDMARTAGDAGARFAVVVFPYRDQVEKGASTRVQEQLAELGRERGFEVIDLLPSFLAAAPREPLFLDAWHPTPAGHRVAAETIRERLQSLGWVAAPASP